MRYSELIKEKLRVLAASKNVLACLLTLVMVIPVLFHMNWPLLLVVFIAFALYMPVPRVLDGLIGRLFYVFMLLYAALQFVSVIQLFVFPHSGFVLAGVLLAFTAVALLLLYGRREMCVSSWIRKIDLFVLGGCMLFLACLSPIIVPKNASYNAAEVAGVQIIDSVRHWDFISRLTINQNLAVTYYTGGYYPSGFHYAAAFIEDAFSLGNSQHSWLTNAKIYFAQYVFFGFMLEAGTMYFSFSLLERVYAKARPTTWMFGAVAASVGVTTIFLHLLLFVSEGFLNYLYVCATILFGMCFLVERDMLLASKSRVDSTLKHSYPLTMYLLFASGASLSWPLLTPPLLLSAAFLVRYPRMKDTYGYVKSRIGLLLPVFIMAVVNLLAIYIQEKYLPDSKILVNLPGALQNFDVVLFIVGIVILSIVIFINKSKESKLLTALFAPFILLVAGLMLYQFFTQGEATYYLIKVALVVEMFTVVMLSVYAVTWVERGTDMSLVLKFCWPVLAVVGIVLATIGTVPQPLIEVRSIYRNISGLGKPPFLDSDASAIAHLGGQNDIDHFNVTILHYNPLNRYYYAQIETAIWANAMSTHYADAQAYKSNVSGLRCFTKQYALLIQGVSNNNQQKRLVSAVYSCMNFARSEGVPYYIVTDSNSVTEIRKQFGPAVHILE